MIENKEIWAYEKAYLEKVIGEIKMQLEIGINAADNYKSEAIKLQKSMWEDLRCAPSSLFDLEDAAQINQIQMDLRNKASLYRFSSEKVSHLKTLLKSPYFGRVDFLENGEKAAEPIYIGIHSLSTNESMNILVYDWRAPISSMFYDFEIGPSSYVCPDGVIKGVMQLKRQYKIENAGIVYMFDSSLNINDAMLQELLGKSTDSKMRTIVTSIQKEQNSVIRNSGDKILIVEGPAGSGKTSIALHRAAYVLYRFKDTVKSENILIFSPNHVFEDYISHVLPELGEENIRRSTFADFFENLLSTNLQRETMNQQMEYILNASASDKRLDCIKFKSSPIFLAALKGYVKHIENGMKRDYKNITDSYTVQTVIDIESLYIQFLENIKAYLPALDKNERENLLTLAGYTISEQRKGLILYEDLAPMIYLKTVLEKENIAASVKHIIIDEAQDYTPVQYEIFKTVFKGSNMTILGDINQSVNGYMNIGSFDTISDVFSENARRIALKKSYRSSKEIADFCRGLLASAGFSEQLNRHGAKPKVIKLDKNSFYKRLAEDISYLRSIGYKLIAVICKSASHCKAVYQALNAYMDISLISNQNEVYYGDVVVIPSYLSKGLEFDAVLVDSVEDKNYHMPEERKLLYTVCTRALHQLYLYYSDTLSRFVSDIDEELYISEATREQTMRCLPRL